MIERRRQASLAFEAGPALRVDTHAGRQQLQRNLTPERQIPGQINHSHTAAAEFTEHAEVTDLRFWRRVMHQDGSGFANDFIQRQRIRVRISGEERRDLVTKSRIRDAGQKGFAFRRRQPQGRVQHGFDLTPVLQIQLRMDVCVPG